MSVLLTIPFGINSCLKLRSASTFEGNEGKLQDKGFLFDSKGKKVERIPSCDLMPRPRQNIVLQFLHFWEELRQNQ